MVKINKISEFVFAIAFIFFLFDWATTFYALNYCGLDESNQIFVVMLSLGKIGWFLVPVYVAFILAFYLTINDTLACWIWKKIKHQKTPDYIRFIINMVPAGIFVMNEIIAVANNLVLILECLL